MADSQNRLAVMDVIGAISIAVTLSGIELANKIKKGEFDTLEITGPAAMILQVWEAVLAA
jgi:hypothetical protein